MKSPKIGIRPGGKYADGAVPLEPSVMGFLKDRAQAVASAMTPTPSAARPVVNAVTQNTGLTGAAVTGMQAQNQANLDALNLANGAVALRGPGTATSDSIPVHLSKGESVLPAATTAALGAKTVKRIIEVTNGKSPKIGVRPGGKHADGVVPADRPLTKSKWDTLSDEQKAVNLAEAKNPVRNASGFESIYSTGFGADASTPSIAKQFGPQLLSSGFKGGAVEDRPIATATAPVVQGSLAATPNTERPYGNEEAKILGNSANVVAGQRQETGSVLSGGTVNTVPAGSMSATDPRLLRQLSEARQAAAEREDWDAVNASYGPGGLKGDGSYGARAPAAPDFSQYPGTLEGIMARKAAMQNFALSQGAANKQAELGIRRQTAGTEARLADIRSADTESAAALRTAQAAGVPAETALRTAQAESLARDAASDKARGGVTKEQINAAIAVSRDPAVTPEDAAASAKFLRSVFERPSGPPQGAVEMLRANPAMAAQYDAKYGQGAAKKVLGS